MTVAINLAIYRIVGSSRHIFNPSERSGYELGSGMGMGLGITFVLWLLILRRAPRKATVLAFVIITAAGWLAVHFAGMRR
ncbi:MAG: hypothetical protein ACKOPQ_00450 [Novosphingobium sp.]